MKFRESNRANGVAINWENISHGTKLMKVVLSDGEIYDDISTNGEKLPKIELHALLSESGELYILEEKIRPRRD